MSYSLTARGRNFAYGGFCALLLTACTVAPEQGQSRHEQDKKAAREEAAAEAAEANRLIREKKQREQRQWRVNSLLAAADAALADKRLTLPVHDNAYDRYRAVLLLEPANSAAQAGLESILLGYVELVRLALRSNHVSQARQLLEQAREYYPGNPLLDDVQDSISQAQERSRRQLQRINEQDLTGEEFLLPGVALSRKSAEISRFLTKVAERLRETDESVLIMARTDAEGRWIYKQMKEAVPDYRIRGDIRLTSTPRLQLLPPL